jgi:hypothetical protein
LSAVIPASASAPNHDLTQYLLKLVEERLEQIVDSPVERYRRKLIEDSGNPPSLHRVALDFVFTVHRLVHLPIWWLVTEAHADFALKTLWRRLNPEIARYRRLGQQLKTYPLLTSFPGIEFLSFYCDGLLSVLRSCAPSTTAHSRARIKWGVSKPTNSPPHRQEIFDKALVKLVDYLRDRIPNPDQKQSVLFAHVSKILCLSWGPKLCPDKPRLWQRRYQLAAPCKE